MSCGTASMMCLWQSCEREDRWVQGRGKTILYFYDEEVCGLQEKFAVYAENFPVYEQLTVYQINIWLVCELGCYANIQHHNPVIDDFVREKFDCQESWCSLLRCHLLEPAPKIKRIYRKELSSTNSGF